MTIKVTDYLTQLGVTINRNMTSGHISAACKASSRDGVMMRLCKLIPIKAKLQIYKAAFLPCVTYCGLKWHFCRRSDSEKELTKDGQIGVPHTVNCRAKLRILYNGRLQDIAIFISSRSKISSCRNIFQIYLQ